MLELSESSLVNTSVSSADDPLFNHTKLAPLSPGRELERISFTRSREIPIDWDEVVGKKDTDGKPYVVGLEVLYIKKYLEKHWGYPNGVVDDAEAKFIDFNFVQWSDPPYVMLSIAGSQRSFIAAIEQNDDFYPPPMKPIFSNLTDYENFWLHVKEISSPMKDASELEVVDLAPAIIYRQYRELLALKTLGTALALNADKIAARELNDFASTAELDSITSGYLGMRSVLTDVEVKLERLRDRARDLGYYLALSNEKIQHPDGSVDEVDAGQIYQPYLAMVQWQTVHYRRALVRSSFLFFESSWSISIPYYKQHNRRVTRYQKIIPDFDPWIEKEQELSAAGFYVYRFERVGQRYITAQGESLEEIVERCEVDVDFCSQCAVLLPMYEQSLVKGEILSRYIVIKRPREGLQPIHLPRLFIEEELLFSTHFKCVEVGELVESINLAPGEEREIIIEKTTLIEQEARRTATSISDLTENERVDFSSEMERETTQSTEKSSSRSLSARAGGSYGPFSGSAEGSTSSTLTTRQFARDLQKIANKASKSVTSQTRQEVKTESSLKSNASTRESTKINIQNINEGRSLNLTFYQLYNVYGLSLRLEKLTFTLLSGREIIAGSGIVVPEVFSLDQLGRAIERMELDSLPITPNGVKYPNNPANPSEPSSLAREDYYKELISAVKKTLEEYKKGGNEGSTAIEAGDWEPADPAKNSAKDKIDALVKSLNAIRYTGSPILPPGADSQQSTTLVIGSPGLFLDSHVGSRPSTEPYSECMRDVELEKRKAEVAEVEARASYFAAMARRAARPDPGNTVIGRALDLQTLELTFSSEPLLGSWSVYIANAHAIDFEIRNAHLTITVSFPSNQHWLDQTSADVATLVHHDTKQELMFLI